LNGGNAKLINKILVFHSGLTKEILTLFFDGLLKFDIEKI